MRSRRIAILAVVLAIAAVAGALLYRSSSKSKSRTSNAPSSSASSSSTTSDGGVARHKRHAARDEAVKDPDPVGPLRLEGQVIDADEKGVGGATVAITSNPIRRITTEDDGSFVIDGLLPRTYTVIARKDAAVSTTTTIRVRDTTEPVILRLHATVTVAIHVVDDVTDAPIAGAYVGTSWLLEQDAETDADGVALLVGNESWFFCDVEADGYAPANLSSRLPEDPGGRIDRTVRMSRGAALSGVVLGSDGKPVGDAHVWAEGGEHTWAGEDTEPDGTFRFDTLSPATYELTVEADGYPFATSGPIELDGKTPRDGVEIRLIAGARVRGEVVDAKGAPVPLAQVKATVDYYPRETTADAAGKFEITGVEPAAKVGVTAEADDRGSAVVVVDTRAGDVDGVHLVLEDGVIAGVVVDQNGEPVPEASIQAMPASLNDIVMTGDGLDLTDSAGRFQLGPMAPGDYLLLAAWPGTDPMEAMRAMDWDRTSKGTHTGTRDAKVVLPAAAELTGVVILDGAPVTEYVVAAGRWAAGGTPHKVHAKDGRFVLRGLLPGKTNLIVVGDVFGTHEIDDITVEPGKRTDLGRIEVHTARVLHGHVVDPAGKAVPGATVVVAPWVAEALLERQLDDDPLASAMRNEHHAITDADGAFTMTGVTGSARQPLQAMADHPKVGRSAQVTVGIDQTDLTLTLLATGAIRGKVTNAGESATVQVSLISDAGPTSYASTSTGAYEITDLIPGKYNVAASGGGRGTPTIVVEVKGGETTNADIEFLTGPITLVVHVGDRKCNQVSLQLVDSPIEHDEILGQPCEGPDVELEALPAGNFKICLGSQCTPVTIRTSPARQLLDLSGT